MTGYEGTVATASAQHDILAKRDPRPIPAAAGEIRLFARIRDEALRLPFFLDYHRALGVDRFFIVDNGSIDGSDQLLLEAPDVHCFHVGGSYSAARAGIRWLNTLLDAFGDGHWCLIVDADELFVFMGAEQAGLRGLTGYLDHHDMRAVFALMLEMYGPQAIAATAYSPGGSLIDACPYFDPGPYETVPSEHWPPFKIFGGPRMRAFWGGSTPNPEPPALSKVPLVRWSKGLRYMHSSHNMMAPLPLADLRAALLHFKFLHDFPARARLYAARGEHYKSAREYQRYAACMSEQPDLTLLYEGSLRYEGTAQLEGIGILVSSERYRQHLAGHRAAAS